MSKNLARVVLVSGLSGAGRTSILRTLEDIGYETVDNPPLPMIEQLVARSERDLGIGVDTRSRGYDPAAVLATLGRLKATAGLRAEMVYAWAEETVLLRRYTETRRRHPLAPDGRVSDGVAAETTLTASLREAADLVVDTSELPLQSLRRLIEARFAGGAETAPAIALISFAYPAGLPREADLVLDARFLHNPFYDLKLRHRTGLDPEVVNFIESDPDFARYRQMITEMLAMLLPRFIQEGKKYVTIAIGCSGGRHRSVHLVETLASHLTASGWHVNVTHRELSRDESRTPPAAARAGRASFGG